MNQELKTEFARLWIATDVAFDEKDKSKKGAAILAVRTELAELLEGATALRVHFDVDKFDDDKSIKDFPSVSRIRAKKGSDVKKSGNPFLVG